jgi:excisionase family DNA binding protein
MITLLKPKEVAARLRIDESTVYKMAKKGKIGSYAVYGNSIRISEEDLEKYLESRRMKAIKS